MSTLYASFANPHEAERAAAALLDHGARAEDISILASGDYHDRRLQATDATEAAVSEQTAKSGITTTTAADAGIGAAKGTMVGLGAGIVAALASIFIPGVGLIIGGGALATAVAGAAASAGAGAIAGGIAGYLKDQGMGEDLATHYSEAFSQGGAVLAIAIPTGDLDGEDVEPYLVKYGALNVSTVNRPRNLMEQPGGIDGFPVHAATPIEPTPSAASLTSMTTVPAGPAATEVDVIPTSINPVTGTMRDGIVVDPITGAETPVVRSEPVVVEPVTTTPAVGTVSGYSITDVTPVEVDPVTGHVVRGYVTDPVTGGQRPVRVVNGSIVYADFPATGP